MIPLVPCNSSLTHPLPSLTNILLIPLLQVLDWFTAKGLNAYSISCGQALIYNNLFPKHKVTDSDQWSFGPSLQLLV